MSAHTDRCYEIKLPAYYVPRCTWRLLTLIQRLTQLLSRTKEALFHSEMEKTLSLSVSHLCISSPCPSRAGPGSCGWRTAGLWSSSPDWPGPRQQTCTFAVLARTTPARRRTAPRTHTAGRCSPPEQSLLSGPGQPAGPCRTEGSPWARTSASDRKSLSHPVGHWCHMWFTDSVRNLFTQFTWWNKQLNRKLNAFYDITDVQAPKQEVQFSIQVSLCFSLELSVNMQAIYCFSFSVL